MPQNPYSDPNWGLSDIFSDPNWGLDIPARPTLPELPSFRRDRLSVPPPIDPPRDQSAFSRFTDILNTPATRAFTRNNPGNIPYPVGMGLTMSPQMLEGMTSPLGIASTAGTVLGGAGVLPQIARPLIQGAGALQAGVGINDLTQGNYGQAALNTGMGALAMLLPGVGKPSPRLPQVKPPVSMLEQLENAAPSISPRPTLSNNVITDPRRMLAGGFEPPKQSIPLLPPAEPLPLYSRVTTPARTETVQLNPNRIAVRGSTPAPPQSTGVPDITVPTDLKPVTAQESAFNALIPERFKGPNTGRFPAGRLPSEEFTITKPGHEFLVEKPLHLKPLEPPKPGLLPAVPGDKTTAINARLIADKIVKKDPVLAQAASKDPTVISKAAEKLTLGQKMGQFYQDAKTFVKHGGTPFGGETIEREIEKLGPGGRELYLLAKRVLTEKNQLAARWEGFVDDHLKHLSKDEYVEFWKGAEGAPVTNPRVKAALAAYQKTDAEATTMAQSIGLMNPETKKPWMPRKGYTPRIYPESFTKDPEAIFKAITTKYPNIDQDAARKIANGIGGDDIIARIMASAEVDAVTAKKILNIGLKQSERKIGAQYSRELNLPGYRTDLNVFKEHYADLAKKIAEQKYYGKMDIADPNSPISQAIAKTTNPTLARDMFSMLLGREEKLFGVRDLSKVNEYAGKMSAALYLSLFRISNISNQLAIPVTAGLKNYGKALMQTLATARQESRAFANDAGATYATSKNMIQGLTDTLVNKAYGVSTSENFNRTISAVAGKMAVQDYFTGLKSGKLNAKYVKLLEDLTLSPADDLIKQAELTPTQIKNAGGRMAEIAQGLADPMKVPVYWNSPWLQIPLQFKKYQLQMTKTVKDAVLRDPVKNIPILLGGSQIFGELVGGAKSVIKGAVAGTASGEGSVEGIKKEWGNRGQYIGQFTGVDNKALNRIIDNAVQSWALGMYGDLFFLSTGDAQDMAYDLVGPGIGTGLTAAADFMKILQGKVEPMGRDILKRVPFIGSGLARGILPTRYQQAQDNRLPGLRMPRR